MCHGPGFLVHPPGTDRSLCRSLLPRACTQLRMKTIPWPHTSSIVSETLHRALSGGCQQVPAPSPATPEGRASLCASNTAKLTKVSRQGEAGWKHSDVGQKQVRQGQGRAAGPQTCLHLFESYPLRAGCRGGLRTHLPLVVEDVGSSPHCIPTISLSA